MTDYIKELFSQAQMSFAMTRYDTAIDLCNKAIKLEPTAAPIYTLLGNVYLVREDLAQAERYFRIAVDFDRESGERYFDLANSLFGQEKLGEALQYYAMAEQHGCPDEVKRKIYYLMGILNQVSGNSKEALVNFDKSDSIQGINADEQDMLLNRIQIYVEQGNLPMAEHCATQLKLLIPSEFQSYHLLFQLLLEQSKVAQAGSVLKEANQFCLNMTPDDHWDIGLDYALLYSLQAEAVQNAQEKERIYRKALSSLRNIRKDAGDGYEATPSKQCEVVISMAEIYVNLGDYQNASRYCEQVVNLQDSTLTNFIEEAHFLLIGIYSEQNDYDKVLIHAKALKTSEELAYRYHGYYSEAFATKQLAKRNPDNPDLQRKAISLYDNAIGYFRNCTMTSPGDFLAYLYRARAYVDTGRYSKAIELSKLLPEADQKTLQDYIDRCKAERIGGGNS